MVANAATTWREGKGAKTEGEGRWACGEAGAGWRARPGRKDGEGRIDSNPNNNKAIKGRLRPAPLALGFPEIWGAICGGRGGRALALERSKLRAVEGRWCGRRGGRAGGPRASVWTPSRVVLLCDSAPRPPRLPRRGDDARCGLGPGVGVVIWGGAGCVRRESPAFAHRGSEGVTGLRGEWGRATRLTETRETGAARSR